MQKWIDRGILFFLLSCCVMTAAGAELVGGRIGKAVIVLNEKPTAAAQMAAYELRHHIREITGTELPIATKPEDGKLPIYVGESPYSPKDVEFKPQEYLVDIRNDRIVLAGKDDQDFRKVDYSDVKTFPDVWKEIATLHAVYDFLERAGVRWYLPTELGTAFTPTKDLTVANGLIRRTPSFEMRFIGYNLNSCFPEKLYADTVPGGKVPRLNARDTMLWYMRWRCGGKRIVINHSLGAFNERFAKTKPEWFAKGQKLTWDTQLCYTNPEVIAQAVKDARDYFDGKVTARTVMGGHYSGPHDPNVYSMVPMDHSGFCQCPGCKAMLGDDSMESGEVSSGKWASRLFFSFVNAVAKEVKKTHPDKTIAVLSYADYAWPPENFRLEDNIMVKFCVPVRSPYNPKMVDLNRKRLEEWTRQYPKMKKYVWIYYCWPVIVTRNSKGRTLPGYFAHHVKDYFKDFEKAGVRGMFWEPSASAAGNLVLMDMPEGYVNWKLAWDNTLDAEKLIDEFFTLYYGPAEKPMKEFYNLIESVYCDPKNYPENPGIWASYPMSRFLTPDRAEKLKSRMAEAKRSAEKEPFKSRVELFDKGICQYIFRELEEEGKRIPCMQQESVPFLKVSEPGNPAKVDWKKASYLKMYGGTRAEALRKSLSVQIAHDGEWLYIKCFESIAKKDLRINQEGIFRDDCWEMFFSSRRAKPYRQLGISSGGESEGIENDLGIKSFNLPRKVEVKVATDWWTASAAVKLSEIVPGGVKPGDILYFNLLRTRHTACSACWIPTFGVYNDMERLGELYLNSEQEN